MKVYFLRHATASDEARTDEERELTREGKREAHVLGAALVRMGAKPIHIFSSPLVRAWQTARMVAKVMQFSSKVEELSELKNETSTSALLRVLRSCDQDQEIFLVGHAPSLPQHMAALVGAKRFNGFALGKGGAACVEWPASRLGEGQLIWLMRQKQLRLVAG